MTEGEKERESKRRRNEKEQKLSFKVISCNDLKLIGCMNGGALR